MTSTERSYLKSFAKTILFPVIISILSGAGALAQENYPEITEFNCPKPMIWYTDSNITSDMYCVKQCCLSCPFPNNFYPDGALDKLYRTFAVFGIISFFMMVTLVLWFLVLPSQKTNQTTRLILLPFAISVCFFEFPEFFTLQQQKSQCTNSVSRATIYDNRYCATQAFFTLGGAYAIASWAALLMLHLHLISIWRSEFIIRNILYFNIYIWGTSLLAAIIPLAAGKVEANNFCFIDRNYASIYYYFLCFIYVSFLAHLMTFAYMVKVTTRANWRASSGSMVNKRISIIEAQRAFSHVKTIFKLQWRALLGAVLMLIVYVINWIYFIFISEVDIDAQTFLKWIECLMDGGSQTSCSPKVIPPLGWTIALLFFNRFLGILIFFILAAKKSILVEVWDLLNGRIEVPSTASLHARYPSPDSRMTSIEWGERANGARTSGETSSSRESSSTISSSTTSPEIPPSAMIKNESSGKGARLNSPTIISRLPPSTPARASFGIMSSASKFPIDVRPPKKQNISFSERTSESSRRMSSGSSHSSTTVSSAAAPNGGVMKVNRSYERRKRRSRDLATKIARSSITEEILEDEWVSEMSPQKRYIKDGDNENGEKSNGKVTARRTTFGDEGSEKWVRIKEPPRSSSEP